MVFCNSNKRRHFRHLTTVTILILIDGFLQYKFFNGIINAGVSHNPYFNRWFSAMSEEETYAHNGARVTILILIDGFLQ